jgi:hypothetical protein
MTQRLALATAAGLLAFVGVLLGAVGVYVVVQGPAVTTALAAPVQQDTANPTPGAPRDQGRGTNPPPTYPVSADDAAQIALTNVPGAALAGEPRLVNVNGTIAYEVVLDRGYVYVDANSGQVLYNSAGGQTQPNRRRGRR